MSAVGKLLIALPILNEFENIEEFIRCIKNQNNQDFELVVCVNQYDDWWNDPEKVALCEDNQKCIAYLKQVSGITSG